MKVTRPQIIGLAATILVVGGIIAAAVHNKLPPIAIKAANPPSATSPAASQASTDVEPQSEASSLAKKPAASQSKKKAPAAPKKSTKNTFTPGYSEWWAAWRRIEVGKPLDTTGVVQGTTANAYCRNQKLVRTPALHAVGCYRNGYAAGIRGHMVFVEKVNGSGSIWVSEMNSFGQVSIKDKTKAGGWHQVSYRLISKKQVESLLFIR